MSTISTASEEGEVLNLSCTWRTCAPRPSGRTPTITARSSSVTLPLSPGRARPGVAGGGGDRLGHQLVFHYLARAHARHHAEDDVGVERRRVTAVAARERADEVKVIGRQRAVVADDKQDADALGLRLQQALQRHDRAAAPSLLDENPVGLRRETGEREVVRVWRLLGENLFEMIQHLLEFRR